MSTALEIIEQSVVTAGAGIITACGVAAAAWLRSHLKNQQLRNLAADSASLAAGVAHDALTTAVANGAPDWVAAKQVAITEGIAAAKAELATDVTPAAVAAGLATLLAPSAAAPTSTPTAGGAAGSIPAAVKTISDAVAALGSLAPLAPVAGAPPAAAAPSVAAPAVLAATGAV